MIPPVLLDVLDPYDPDSYHSMCLIIQSINQIFDYE